MVCGDKTVMIINYYKPSILSFVCTRACGQFLSLSFVLCLSNKMYQLFYSQHVYPYLLICVVSNMHTVMIWLQCVHDALIAYNNSKKAKKCIYSIIVQLWIWISKACIMYEIIELVHTVHRCLTNVSVEVRGDCARIIMWSMTCAQPPVSRGYTLPSSCYKYKYTIK